ncbi:MAG: SDR family oxidoreductase, partial [Flavobacteriales bacterium]|nr:SDR family oxidoreductase [Flavobacteriales bacterium]
DIRDKEKMNQIFLEEKPNIIVHLAAIVGDPACKALPLEAESTNDKASVYLLQLANRYNVEQFIFSSTCSNYGKTNDDEIVHEDSLLNPVSLYAESKVNFEKLLLANSNTSLNTCVLRFATVFGISPRMRFDLTINEFTRDLHLGKELHIYGPQFWRPYCHVQDLARSISLIIESDRNKTNRRVFNVGSNKENFQKAQLAEKLKHVIPNCQIAFVDKEKDPRSYQVCFDRITNELGYTITKNVDQGIEEIKNMLANKEITDPFHEKHRNT